MIVVPQPHVAVWGTTFIKAGIMKAGGLLPREVF
jgi:hypothetical protein